MSAADNGGPAFASPGVAMMDPQIGKVRLVGGSAGMTLRDYFAGQALPAAVDICRGDSYVGTYSQHVAKAVYEIAEAMLRERERQA